MKTCIFLNNRIAMRLFPYIVHQFTVLSVGKRRMTYFKVQNYLYILCNYSEYSCCADKMRQNVRAL